MGAGSGPPLGDDGEPGGGQLTSDGDLLRQPGGTYSWRRGSGSPRTPGSSACGFGCRPGASGCGSGACRASHGADGPPQGFERQEPGPDVPPVAGEAPGARLGSSSRAATLSWACWAWPLRLWRSCSRVCWSIVGAWPSWTAFGCCPPRVGCNCSGPEWPWGAFVWGAMKASGDDDGGAG